MEATVQIVCMAAYAIGIHSNLNLRPRSVAGMQLNDRLRHLE